jgi:hypothetical protein
MMIRLFWQLLRDSEKTPAKNQVIDLGSQQVPNKKSDTKNKPFGGN